MLSKEEKYISKCIKLAEIAYSKSEVPVGAVVIKDGKIIASGYNRRLLDSDPTAHAEIVALRKAAKKLGTWNLSGCELAVSLEPCAMCAGAIVSTRIKTLYFGAYDTRFGYCGSLYNLVQDNRLNHTVEVFGGILANECLMPIKEFFKERRK